MMKLLTIPRFRRKKDHQDESESSSSKEHMFEAAFGKKERPKDADFQTRLEEQARAGGQRLLDVFNAAVVPLAPAFCAPVHWKSKAETQFIQEAIADSLVFQHLTKLERHSLIQAFDKVTLSGEHKTLIGKGNKVTNLYIVETGSLQDGEGETYGAKSLVGELALLYEYPSPVSVQTTSKETTLWRLDQLTFRKALAAYAFRGDQETMNLLKKVDLFKPIYKEDLMKISMALTTVTYQKGDTVCQKGEECRAFYIVKEGSVQVTGLEAGGSTYDDLTLKPGQAFGETLLLRNEPYIANVTAVQDNTTLLCLDEKVFVKIFSNMEGLLRKAQDKKILMAIPVADKPKLTTEEVDTLVSLIKNYKVPSGHVFFHQGEPMPSALYLIRDGTVSIKSTFQILKEALAGMVGWHISDKNEHFITAGGYFGADSLVDTLGGGAGPPAPFTIFAQEGCQVGVLTLKDILSVLGTSGTEGGEPTIPFEDLEMYRILGAGTFGKVWLVSQKGTEKAYALKVQGKRKTIEFGQVEGVVREKNAMARLDHPFIIRLISSYKDNRSLYMLMKLYQGGELRSVLHTGKRLGVPEPVAKFYAANMLQGLDYMHARKMMHRDLKPENVLLDENGYTVLVDLGFARLVPDRTYTFCGTPIYIAPEVIKQRGYNHSADLWSWAIMLYEMIVGVTPFFRVNMSQMALFKSICKGKVKFPNDEGFMSADSKNLLRQLLVVEPYDRLGMFAGGHQDIRDHPFFCTVDFDAIDGVRSIQVPWKPEVKDPLDVDNFDEWGHLDKDEKREEPLSKREDELFDAF